ncbi:aspartate aminotransferase family protein [Streptomyces sp. NPDC048309]|uniref:aspartate aminotransferase family protein n=1 Tax=Streptomyces sp. NPDC048309 TaxID=3154618 RepID=UPI0033FD879D
MKDLTSAAHRDDLSEALYYPVGDRRMSHGSGIFVYDDDGRDYLDCSAGTFNLSLGYSHPEIVKVLQDQASCLVHLTTSLQAEPVLQLARSLIRVSPENLTKVHLKVCGGSTANEGAIRMAQLATGRRGVISLFRSHHGQTALTTGVSGDAARRRSLPVLYPGSLNVPDPYCYRCFYGQQRSTCNLMCVNRLDDFLAYASSGDVACFIVEPISGNGGNIVPPHGYFSALREFCTSHGIALIFDEVQTGIGRTGRMFAAQHFGVQPDIITTAKGLGGIGTQAAAIICEDSYTGMSLDQLSFTFGGNVLAAAAATKTIEIISRPGFLEHVRWVSGIVMERLRDLKSRFPCIGDVRGVGLMIGVELVDVEGAEDVRLTNELARRAAEHRLLLRTSQFGRGNVLKIRPPLIITEEEVTLMCDRLEELFAAVAT